MYLKKTFSFEASHRLPEHPGKCKRLHGHSYKLVVTVKTPNELDASGITIDFGHVSDTVKMCVIEKLDHRHLNDILPRPSAEALAVWIWEQLSAPLRTVGAELCEIELWETHNSAVIYRGENRHELVKEIWN